MRTTLSSIAVLAALGAPAMAQDLRPPGRLVDIGGRRVHLHCTGTAAPTVVIEAGASSFAIDFSLVQPDASKTTRVCSYDRAGSGWSDARPDVDTPLRTVRDLRTVLERGGEQGPFVMVGASRGSALDRKLMATMPPTVSGEVVAESAAGDYAMLSRLSAARRTTPTLLADLPVIVLSRGLNASPEQRAAHADLSRLSRNSRHLVVADSYHEIHLSHPDVVVAAIRDVVASIRTKAPLR